MLEKMARSRQADRLETHPASWRSLAAEVTRLAIRPTPIEARRRQTRPPARTLVHCPPVWPSPGTLFFARPRSDGRAVRDREGELVLRLWRSLEIA